MRTDFQVSETMSSLSKEAVNGFRYQVAVAKKGGNVFMQVFKWTYQGGNQSIKTYFLSLVGNTNAFFRSRFNGQQRRLLESGAPIEDFDISLLYLVLQHVCGLAGYNDPAWISSPSGRRLEHLMYKLKQERNDIAHSATQPMSDKTLKKKLKKLKILLSKILRLAGNRCGIRPNIFRDLVCEINFFFKDLLEKVREPLDPSDLKELPQLQQEIQLFRDTIQRKLQEDSQRELHDFYPQQWDVDLVNWLYTDYTIRPSINFTRLVIREDLSKRPKSRQHQDPRDVSHEEILKVPRQDGSLPEVIIISGDGGMGKTTLLKYMLENWVTDSSLIEGLQDVSPLLYLQLRGSSIRSWKEMLKNLLPVTFQNSHVTSEFFCDMFLTMKVLVLLDGYDEANRRSKELITDLLSHQGGNMRLVITTRPGFLKELTQIVQSKKKLMAVEIKGIRKEDRPAFVSNTLVGIVHDQIRRDELKENILTILENLKLEKNELDVPLNLTLLTVREVETPGHQSSTDVFKDLTTLMKGKVEERLTQKMIADAEDKVKEYHEFLEEISFRNLKTNEHDLLPDTVECLKSKCASLGLPHKEMFSGFLISKKSKEGMFIVETWSYPHNRFQEHWAANHVVNKMKADTAPNLTNIKMDNQNVTQLYQRNPLLQIYAKGPDEVKQIVQGLNVDVLRDIFCSVTYKLALLNENLLDIYAVAIISLVKCTFVDTSILYFDESYDCNLFCQFVEASRERTSVLEAVAKALSGRKWLSVSVTLLAAVTALVGHVHPKGVEVHMKGADEGDLPSCQQLRSLKTMTEEKVEIKLIEYFSQVSPKFCELCLKAMTEANSPSTLIEYECPLTAVGMQFLPDSLVKLHIRTDMEGLRELTARIPHLQKIQDLCKSFYC